MAGYLHPSYSQRNGCDMARKLALLLALSLVGCTALWADTGLINNGGFTPHSVVTRVFCSLMGRPAVIKTVFPGFVRAYMRANNPTDKAIVDRVVARAKTDGGARTAAALWKSFTEPGHDLRTRAAQISVPVLITWGAKDVTAPARWGKAVAAAIPGSRFETLPTGHVVFSSEPQAWLKTVLPFVDAALISRR